MIGLASIKRYRNFLILAAVTVAAGGSAWTAQGWRMGKRLEAQRADYAEAKGRRGQAYADTMAQAAQAATIRVTEAQALLAQARDIKAKALAEAAQKAPKGPAFDCLKVPLPDDYLETFRQ